MAAFVYACAVMGIVKARAGDKEGHRVWMFRFIGSMWGSFWLFRVMLFVIDPLLRNHEAAAILERQRRNGSAWVFPSRFNPEKRRSLELSLWRKVRRKARIEDVRLHDLRHTFASHAVRLGTPIPVVSRLLGHTSTRMTLRYAHAGDRETEAAAERIGAFIAGLLDGRRAGRDSAPGKAVVEKHHEREVAGTGAGGDPEVVGAGVPGSRGSPGGGSALRPGETAGVQRSLRRRRGDPAGGPAARAGSARQ